MNKNKNSLEFNFSSFKINKYELNEPPIKVNKKSKVGFAFKSGLNIDESKDQIQIIMIANMDLKIRKKPFIFASIETKSSFTINNIYNYMENKEIINLPDDFVKTLFGIAYSTTRGAFYAMGKGNIPSFLILPLINPADLIPKQISDHNSNSKNK